MSAENPIRAAILQALAGLADKLDEFEQTTHARLVMAPGIEGIVDDLVAAYRDPRGYTVSNLAQGIRALLKEEK